jgi:outer membrane receptor protein involved in Fe transport
MKKFELLTATAVTLMWAAPALAQSTTPPATPVSQADPAADGQTTDGDDPSVSGEDIVVTASKRETTLLDTPISVSVTGAETIQQAQIRDLRDLQTVVPSLRVNQLQSSANTNFIIRGFGNGANNAGIEPSVGVFIDGVYRSRSAAQISDLPNLRRIEVLRGPQSTLFGKNASAGIISIVTAEPAFEFGGAVEASYGNYNAVVVKADVTGPISETLAFSLAGNYNRRDGYVRDLQLQEDVNDRNRYGFRGQLRFDPSSDLRFRLIADYDKIDENCCGVVNVVNGPTGAIGTAIAGRPVVDPANPFSYRVFNNFLSANLIKNYGASLQGDYTMGSIGLTSITAYRKVDAFTNQDSDFTGLDSIGRNSADVKIDTFTQELRLASDFDGPLNFLLGGFYFNEKISQANHIFFGSQFRPYADQLVRAASGGVLNIPLLENTFGALEGAPTRYVGAFGRAGSGLDEQYKLSDESYSIFGTVDFELTDRLTLTGGFNYTDDRKRFSTNVVSTDAFAGINLDAPQYAPFRNQLLFGGALAQTVGSTLRLGRNATQAEIGAFAAANAAAFGQISAGAQAFANANQNVPAANPLAGLRALQFLPPFQNVPNAVEPGRTSDDDISYTARISYKATDNINVYATYATGFKASSINLSRDSRPTPGDLTALRTAGSAVVNLTSGSRFAAPEKARVIEGGIKGQFRGFAFNVAIFDQELKGFQGNVFTGTGFVLSNAGSQSTRGFELDTSLSPSEALTFTAALTYLDAKYDSFPAGSAFTPGLTVGAADLTGVRPGNVPEFALAVGGVFTQPIGESAKMILRADFNHESNVQIAEGAPRFKREVNSLNAAVILQLDQGFEFSAWGRNLTNDQYLSTIFPSVAQAGSLSAYPSQPRTYGVSGRFRF